ncbi:MAG TPA: hypothetical protein VF189_04390 [Patescibacteria group bacterium]
MKEKEQEVSFKGLFYPFTSVKAICWITIIGLVVYFFGLFNGFVWDDQPQITENPVIQSLQNFPSFFLGGTFYSGTSQPTGFSYKPLLNVFFAVNYFLGGGNAFPFHFFQIVLYIANVAILFLVLKKFFNKKFSFILSLIFMIHPINSESAYYISASQEVLFFFFGISALFIIQNYQTVRAFVLMSMLLFASILSKETGFLFILITFFYVLFYEKKYWKWMLISTVSVSTAYVVLRYFVFSHLVNSASYAPIQNANFFIRLINVPLIIFFYVKTFFLPVDLAMSYQWLYKSIDLSHFFIPLLTDIIFFGVIIGAGTYLYKKNIASYKDYLFFLVWFVSGLSIHLQIFPLDQTVADRWFYFPIVGLLGLIGIIVQRIKLKHGNFLLISLLTVIFLALGLRTFLRGFDWKDDLTAVTHDIKISKDSYNLEGELGYIYLKEGKYKEAKIHAEKSVFLSPNTPSYINIGVADIHMGDYKGANDALLKSLKYGDSFISYDSLGALYVMYGNPEKNMTFMKKAVEKYPYDWKLWMYFAELEYNFGNKELAKKYIGYAYSLNGNDLVTSLYKAMMNNQKITIGKKN